MQLFDLAKFGRRYYRGPKLMGDAGAPMLEVAGHGYPLEVRPSPIHVTLLIYGPVLWSETVGLRTRPV